MKQVQNWVLFVEYFYKVPYAPLKKALVLSRIGAFLYYLRKRNLFFLAVERDN